jgi:hypothetical protein
MILVSSSIRAVRLLCLIALFAGTVKAQEPLPQKPSKVANEVEGLKDARGIPREELDRAKQLFATLAKYYADVLANPAVYRAPLDTKFGAPGPRVPTVDRNSQTGILLELDQFILKPQPLSKVNNEKADYIRELGGAFDAALKPLIQPNQERIVQINAARVLAELCKSGATPHWPTVTALLNNANTPAEVKNYALHAAANLLAAYDMNDYRSRKHSNSAKEVVALVRAVTDCIVPPADGVSSFYPGLKMGEVTPDQVAVIQFVRRQAIRALAQVRFVTVLGPDEKPAIYPAYTLVRVCVSDPGLLIAPSPAECGEAIIGICNMADSNNGYPVKGYNRDGSVEAIVAGLITFSGPRSEPTDRSLPWRQFSIRMSEAMKNWRPLFDPTFEPTDPNRYDTAAVPASVNELIQRAQTMVLGPIDKVEFTGKAEFGARVDSEGLKQYLEQLRKRPNRNPLLFSSNPETVIYSPEKN